MYTVIGFLLLASWSSEYVVVAGKVSPIVITTWSFRNATIKARDVLLNERDSAVDAIERGCSVCEIEQCDFTVGYGGSPDENGETTLDAMIMDGDTMNVGAVGDLRFVKSAISVARRVLDHSRHSLLVGDAATAFAKSMGFKEESLSTPYSRQLHSNWLRKNCQPNHWVDVDPDPKKSCGPYSPRESTFRELDMNDVGDERMSNIGENNHDTIGMVAMDENGSFASGTSTNGLIFKMPGRVGDSPIAGAGSYADSAVGGAASTGDGDIMMRFLPSFYAVEEMRRGATPTEAARKAIRRIVQKYPNFFGAVIALKKDGTFGAACNGMNFFPFYVGDEQGIIELGITCN